jgi:hypothetical protein
VIRQARAPPGPARLRASPCPCRCRSRPRANLVSYRPEWRCSGVAVRRLRTIARGCAGRTGSSPPSFLSLPRASRSAFGAAMMSASRPSCCVVDYPLEGAWGHQVTTDPARLRLVAGTDVRCGCSGIRSCACTLRALWRDQVVAWDDSGLTRESERVCAGGIPAVHWTLDESILSELQAELAPTIFPTEPSERQACSPRSGPSPNRRQRQGPDRGRHPAPPWLLGAADCSRRG